MLRINEYKSLIKEIPVGNQSATIKRETWKKFVYHDKERIECEIFGSKDVVELSRIDVLSETDITKKIVMILMWGYPTGGRGDNIQNILKELDSIGRILSPISKDNSLSQSAADKLIRNLEMINGLGISTWSKFLYFFNVTINSEMCQIFDSRIVSSLNKKQFYELEANTWKQNLNYYYEYNELVNSLAKNMDVFPDQVELFLFYYNLYYKF